MNAAFRFTTEATLTDVALRGSGITAVPADGNAEIAAGIEEVEAELEQEQDDIEQENEAEQYGEAEAYAYSGNVYVEQSGELFAVRTGSRLPRRPRPKLTSIKSPTRKMRMPRARPRQSPSALRRSLGSPAVTPLLRAR